MFDAPSNDEKMRLWILDDEEVQQANDVLFYIHECYRELLDQGAAIIGITSGCGPERLAIMSPGRLGYVIISGHIRKVSSMPLHNLLAWLNWHVVEKRGEVLVERQWTPLETAAVIDTIERESAKAAEEQDLYKDTQLDEAQAAR